MVDYQKIWKVALTEIEMNVSKANYGTWFKNTEIKKIENGIVYLWVPNAFVKDWLENKYHKFILKALRNVNGDVRGLEYVIFKTPKKTPGPVKQPEQKKNQNNKLDFNNLYINRDSNLNPKYTFKSFIVGSFNEVAYASSQAVIKKPGMNYNPLFIYGGTGLGKTHLIQSVGNYIKDNYNDMRVYYTTSERFTIDYINSVQNNKGNLFKEKYLKYDLLIMDDVQFLSNKEKTQEELFHLFNNLYDNNKQIIFSSDKPPKYISNLEERLRSRFEGGMIVDINKPDYESRLAILKKKMRGQETQLSDEILEYIAYTVEDSIRELEGLMKTIICQAESKNKEMSLTEVKDMVKNNIKPKKVVTINDVLKIICEYYGIEEKALKQKTRKREVVKPRQMVMYILREDFNTSYSYIGERLGGKDHTTVIHAYEKTKQELEDKPLVKQELEELRAIIHKN